MDHFSYHRSGSVRWYLLGTLIAVEMLMSFSFLGYLHIEPISITIAYIPVLLGGALMGPLESAALGTLFGLSSMWKASASYVMASDQLPVKRGKPDGFRPSGGFAVFVDSPTPASRGWHCHDFLFGKATPCLDGLQRSGAPLSGGWIPSFRRHFQLDRAD